MKKLAKQIISLAMAMLMVCALFCGCKPGKDGPIKLDVFSETANFNGEQTGWIAKMLLEKFNVVLNIIPSDGDVYETRMESGFLGDIVCWGGDGENYTRALKAGMLYDWNEEDLLKECGPYIYENMQDALKKNAELTARVTGGDEVCYGFGYNVATSSQDHDSFFYTWDTRWDLYKELGYPEVKDLDDLVELFKGMKRICPTDDNGNETYAVSMWPDWDGDMVMYVKAFASAYWGYDELGMGLYDPSNGTFHGALEENGPYLQALKFFNTLFREGLVDPNSMTQKYDNMYEKVRNGGVFFSMFNYSGCLAYNNEDHLAAGKMMTSLVPDEAHTIVYGMSTKGGNRIWSIGSNTQHPELCMEIINWLATPEGMMTYYYGPKDLCWYYDEDGYTHWTDFGKTVYFDRDTLMTGDYEGLGTFNSGCLQINNNTWSLNAVNPESNGERYNYEFWKSAQNEASCEIEKDWRDHFGVSSTQEYMEKTNYSLSPNTGFTMDSKDDELKTTWSTVTDTIKQKSWQAIYASSDAEFERIVSEMISEAKGYGYDTCVEWNVEQAALRYAEQLKLTD